MLENRKIIWDSLCELKDSYAQTSSATAASAQGTVDSTAKIFDTGGGFTEGVLDIYASVVTATVTSNPNHYIISLQGSASSTFATPTVELANMELGQSAELRADGAVGSGLYKLRWNNMFGGTVYRYLRTYTTITAGGTIGAGITYTAILSK
jgi:hypothetical protein